MAHGNLPLTFAITESERAEVHEPPKKQIGARAREAAADPFGAVRPGFTASP
jgi:hypothetical protein